MFGVSGSESSFQAEYQKLVESWVRGFVELKTQLVAQQQKSQQGNQPSQGVEKSKQEPENQDVEISTVDGHGNRQLLYGKDEQGNQVCHLSPDQIQQLTDATEMFPGDSVKGLPPLQVKVNEQVLFESDDLGQVLVNQSLENNDASDNYGAGDSGSNDDSDYEPEPDIELIRENPDSYSETEVITAVLDEESSESEKPATNGFQGEAKRQQTLVELMALVVEAVPDSQVTAELERENQLGGEVKPTTVKQARAVSKDNQPHVQIETANPKKEASKSQPRTASAKSKQVEMD